MGKTNKKHFESLVEVMQKQTLLAHVSAVTDLLALDEFLHICSQSPFNRGVFVYAYILELYRKSITERIISNDLLYVVEPALYKFQIAKEDFPEETHIPDESDLKISDEEKELAPAAYYDRPWFGKLAEAYGLPEYVRKGYAIPVERIFDLYETRTITNTIKYQLNIIQDTFREIYGDHCYRTLIMKEEGERLIKPKPPLYVMLPTIIYDNTIKKYVDLLFHLFSHEKKYIEREIVSNSHTILLSFPLLVRELYMDRQKEFEKQFDYFLKKMEKHSDLIRAVSIWNTNADTLDPRFLIKFIYKLRSNGISHISFVTSDLTTIILFCIGIINSVSIRFNYGLSRDPSKVAAPYAIPATFYVPLLHDFFSISTADKLYNIIGWICECPICSGKAPSSLSYKEIIKHNVYSRLNELEQFYNCKDEVDGIPEILKDDFNTIKEKRREIKKSVSRASYDRINSRLEHIRKVAVFMQDVVRLLKKQV